jgi:hypothetical protein
MAWHGTHILAWHGTHKARTHGMALHLRAPPLWACLLGLLRFTARNVTAFG